MSRQCWAFSCSCTSCYRACDFSEVKCHCSIHFKGRTVGTLERSAAVEPFFMYNLNAQWLFFIISYNIFPGTHSSLWFVSETGGKLICIFHCFNKLCPHKFIGRLATYGFNFPVFLALHIRHILCFFFFLTWQKISKP